MHVAAPFAASVQLGLLPGQTKPVQGCALHVPPAQICPPGHALSVEQAARSGGGGGEGGAGAHATLGGRMAGLANRNRAAAARGCAGVGQDRLGEGKDTGGARLGSAPRRRRRSPIGKHWAVPFAATVQLGRLAGQLNPEQGSALQAPSKQTLPLGQASPTEHAAGRRRGGGTRGGGLPGSPGFWQGGGHLAGWPTSLRAFLPYLVCTRRCRRLLLCSWACC